MIKTKVQMNNNIKINLYKNIINSISYINAWQDVKMFDISTLSKVEITKLKLIYAIDICFPSIYSKRNQAYYNKMINQFNLFIKTYFLKNTSYVYLMEHKLKNQDRIRSYKGLFYNTNIKEYVQKEYLINKPYSVIAAIVLFNEKNTNILDQLYDPSTALVVHSEKEISEEKTLDKIINNNACLSDYGNTINYSKIISNF